VQASYGHDDSSQLDASTPSLGLLDDLRGRRAVVTGAARGIGEEIAKSLIAVGADVTVVDRTGSASRRPSAAARPRSSTVT
jgi:phosphoglycerate dehydrogenase-like enzyme